MVTTYLSLRHEAIQFDCRDNGFCSRSPWISGIQKPSRTRRGQRIRVKATVAEKGKKVQNFQTSNFVQPKWLLTTTTKDLTSCSTKETESLFEIVLNTSKDYDAGISDYNAGIWLAFIGQEGKALVHRIPQLSSEAEQTHQPIILRFQRGSVDNIKFYGPDLGKLEAIWVAPERGTWKLEEMSVTVLPQQIGENIDKQNKKNVVKYFFPQQNVLIGDGGTMPAVELQASKSSELSFNEYNEQESSKNYNDNTMDFEQIRDKGMEEYEALKISLLQYDALIVGLGTVVSAASGHGEVAEGFLVGGAFGFVYLLLLQRAVDQLPSTISVNKLQSSDEGFDSSDKAIKNKSTVVNNIVSFKSPLAKISGVIVTISVILRVLDPTNVPSVSKEMFFAAATGFLMSKVATILASNMPLQSRM